MKKLKSQIQILPNPKQIQNPKSKTFLNLVIGIYLVVLVVFGIGICPLFAQEITILYTGETHAMLYPCNCPKEPDGGVARRATLVKQLRKENSNTLLLDSGAFSAGGQMDQYTQNPQLDEVRTKVNLKAMELMQYDAAAIGDDEFSLGEEFLKENIANTKIPFLSANLKFNNVAPYILKEIAGLKVGIIGLTNEAVKQKASDLKFSAPFAALDSALKELKNNNADIIILLSHLGEEDILKLINEMKGIDIIVSGHSRAKEEPFTKIDSTLILRPAWQGKRLGKLVLQVKDKKIVDYKVEELRLSDKIMDEPGILNILPSCFSDADCKKEGFIGVCQNPGNMSRCLFSKAAKVNLQVVTTKSCRVCDTEKIVHYLKGLFPGLSVSYLYYPDLKAKKLVKDFGIKGLPAYLLDSNIDKEKEFEAIKRNLRLQDKFYILLPQFTGVSYFIEREKIKGKLDLFISLYEQNSAGVLEMIKDFNPRVHFLSVEKEDSFDALKGGLEVEDYLRAVCVQKYYPQEYWDYISCRVKNINSSWWEDCLSSSDIEKIRACSRADEGKNLLRENISLNKELQVMFGPTYLLDNQEIFATQGIPNKEDFKKILERK